MRGYPSSYLDVNDIPNLPDYQRKYEYRKQFRPDWALRASPAVSSNLDP